MPPKSASSTTRVSSSRASSKTSTPKEESPVTTATAPVLFGLPEVEPIKTRASEGRPKVDVPDEVLAMLRQAEADGNRLLFPVRDENHYETMANVLYSAGDILNRSITPAPGVKGEGGKFVVVKTPGEATHLRVRVGKRRGVTPSAKKSDDVAGE